jgi:hypothetical protein
MTTNMEAQGKAKGGKARAKSLSPAERQNIAKKAATARWDNSIPVATHGTPDHPLRIGNVEIQCYVLENETRVISQASFLEALGRHRKANVRQEEKLPAILQGKAINQFISQETLEKSAPIKFKTPSGSVANGYRADLLPEVCEIYLKARDAGVLPANQEHVAQQAYILMRGLAHVGIIALVDEATGFQRDRAKDALSQILEAFIAKELQPWLKTFPADFYQEMFRLRGLPYPTVTVRRPQYFGLLTNNIVYDRLAPGVREELQRGVPRNEAGRPTAKYFQKLTQNTGYPKLREHLGSIIMLMKLSSSWADFMQKLDRFHPKFSSTLSLDFDPMQETNEEGV